MQDRVKPRGQTKEEIEKELKTARTQAVAEEAALLAAQIIANYPELSEAGLVATIVLGSVIGNISRPDRLNDFLGDAFLEVRAMAVKIMELRVKMERNP